MNREEKLEQFEHRLEDFEARIIELEELNNELQAISGHSAQELVQLFKTGYTLTSPREAYEHCFRHKH